MRSLNTYNEPSGNSQSVNYYVNLSEWWPWYDKIASLFGYDRSKDQLAAEVLSQLISFRAVNISELRRSLSGRPALVFGAGPSLEANVLEAVEEGLLKSCAVISADGATSALLRVAGVAPEVIVTDLDGNTRDLLSANKRGSMMVVHGHGDNIDKLRRYVPKLRKVIGTTQVHPISNVYNFYGFTNGDRAVFLSAAMGVKLIAIAGMDLGDVIGRYSKRRVRRRVKILKLKVCKELLTWFSSRTSIPLYNVTGHGEDIKGFANITCSELARIIRSYLPSNIT